MRINVGFLSKDVCCKIKEIVHYIYLRKKANEAEPTQWLLNPEETSPEIQNGGTSGSKIGRASLLENNLDFTFMYDLDLINDLVPCS